MSNEMLASKKEGKHTFLLNLVILFLFLDYLEERLGSLAVGFLKLKARGLAKAL